MSRQKVLAALLAAALARSPATYAERFAGNRVIREVRLVPGFQQCETATLRPPPPLPFPACSALPLPGDFGFAPGGHGDVTVTAVLDGSRQLTDMLVKLDLVDVTQAGLPFDGVLVLKADLRYTDRACAGLLCTRQDIFDLPVGETRCGSEAGVSAGHCRAMAMRLNDSIPGLVTAGSDATFEISDFRVFFGSRPVFVEGVHAP